jgi:hypothetical protein
MQDLIELDLIDQYERLETLIESIDPSIINKKPADGAWSIAEVLEHLVKVESGMSRIIYSNKGEDTGRDRFSTTEKIKKINDNREVKVKAPSFSEPTGEVGEYSTSLELIIENRASLKNAINSDKVNWLSATPPHPFAGQVGKRDWYDFLYFHMERHIAQIKEIISSESNAS